MSADQMLDEVYADRNHLAMLVGAMAIQLGGDAGWANDPETPGYKVLLILLPDGGGQISVHVSDQEAAQFEVGPSVDEWDGHTTAEKRKRIAQFLFEATEAMVPRISNE